MVDLDKFMQGCMITAMKLAMFFGAIGLMIIAIKWVVGMF